jgi:Transposase DDE domain
MQNPQAMRLRRETVEHPFGTMKARMGATHFLTKALPKVAAEMAPSVLAYNLTRVVNIIGTKPLWLRSWPENEPVLPSHRLLSEGSFYTAKTRSRRETRCAATLELCPLANT